MRERGIQADLDDDEIASYIASRLQSGEDEAEAALQAEDEDDEDDEDWEDVGDEDDEVEDDEEDEEAAEAEEVEEVVIPDEVLTILLSLHHRRLKNKKPMASNIFSNLQSRELGGFSSASSFRQSFATTSPKSHFLPSHPTLLWRTSSRVFCSTFSSDGQTLITASQDHVVRFYRTSDIETLCNVYIGHAPPHVYRPASALLQPYHSVDANEGGWSLLDVAQSPNSQLLAYTSWSPRIFLCQSPSASSSSEQEPEEGHQLGIVSADEQKPLDLQPDSDSFAVFSVKFSPDSSQLLAGCSDHCLYVYDLASDRRILRIEAHSDDINTVCFASPHRNDLFFSGSDDCLVHVWDSRAFSGRSHKPVGTLVGHKAGLTYVASKGEDDSDRYVLTNGKDQAMKLWDIRKMAGGGGGRGIGEDANLRKQVRSVHAQSQQWDYRWSAPRFSRSASSSSSAPSASSSGSEFDKSLITYHGHRVQQTLIRCGFSPIATTGQQFVYSGSGDGCVYVYDLLTAKIVKVLRGQHRQLVRDVTWHPTANMIVSSSWDSSLCAWTYLEEGASEME